MEEIYKFIQENPESEMKGVRPYNLRESFFSDPKYVGAFDL